MLMDERESLSQMPTKRRVADPTLSTGFTAWFIIECVSTALSLGLFHVFPTTFERSFGTDSHHFECDGIFGNGFSFVLDVTARATDTVVDIFRTVFSTKSLAFCFVY